MGSWPNGIAAFTLFVDDVADTKRFYLDVFGLPVVFEDAVSAVFRFHIYRKLGARGKLAAIAAVSGRDLADPDGWR